MEDLESNAELMLLALKHSKKRLFSEADLAEEYVVVPTIVPPMYRNSYQRIKFQIPTELQADLNYVKVDDSLAFSSVHKKREERAKSEPHWTISCIVLDAEDNRLHQCMRCKEEFIEKGYFKKNPAHSNRLLLIKDTCLISKDGSRLEIDAKFMCCCLHHNVDRFRLRFQLSDEHGTLICTTEFDAQVKQWKKGSVKVLPIKVNMNS